MRGKLVILLFLVSLLAISIFPTLTLEINTETGTRPYCTVVSAGEELLYRSINSIYLVPVEERLRVQSDGALVPIQVISTPDVVYYYGIESFTRMSDAQVTAIPRAVHYRELRLKVGTRGQQQLVVRGQPIELAELAGQGESLIVHVGSIPRALACRR